MPQKLLDMGNRRFRHNAMTKIEDMRPARERFQNMVSLAQKRIATGEFKGISLSRA